jgi:hypothetical protein
VVLTLAFAALCQESPLSAQAVAHPGDSLVLFLSRDPSRVAGVFSGWSRDSVLLGSGDSAHAFRLSDINHAEALQRSRRIGVVGALGAATLAAAVYTAVINTIPANSSGGADRAQASVGYALYVPLAAALGYAVGHRSDHLRWIRVALVPPS